MMLVPKPFIIGDLRGTIYDFELIDDVLPMHQHTEDNVHVTIVARGSFLAEGKDWKRIVKSGDFIDWEPNKDHSFRALEDRSRIVNIVKKHGTTADLANL